VLATPAQVILIFTPGWAEIRYQPILWTTFSRGFRLTVQLRLYNAVSSAEVAKCPGLSRCLQNVGCTYSPKTKPMS